MLFKNAVTALLASGLASALPTNEPLSKRSVNFGFGDEKVRGLNIGGWLVLEPWITPSIFENVDQSLRIVDELTLTQKLGSEAALSILRPHVCIVLSTASCNKLTLVVGHLVYVCRLQKDCRCWIQYGTDTNRLLGIFA